MKLKVLHFSTHNEPCGIARYQELFLAEMNGAEGAEHSFFEFSPNQLHGVATEPRTRAYARLREVLPHYDVLHVQQEFSFYPEDSFYQICKITKDLGKRLVVTVHTGLAAAVQPVPWRLEEPRDIARFVKRNIKASLLKRKMVGVLVSGLKLADIVIVHNDKTQNDLLREGVLKNRFLKILIPVPVVDHAVTSHLIADHLRSGSSDVVLGIVGFINKMKGTLDAVEALKVLPSHYKLAVIGGLHPRGADPFGGSEFYAHLLQKIESLGLADRVYITGYVEDDGQLNALVRECDICIYPYSRSQYGNASSAALNNAFANHRSVVTYPTEPFKEINELGRPYLTLADDFSSGAMAKAVQEVDITESQRTSRLFSEEFSYPAVARQVSDAYDSMFL